jgi:hypothetical protein
MLTNIGHEETESKIKQNNYESAFPSTSEVRSNDEWTDIRQTAIVDGRRCLSVLVQ